MVVKRHGCYPKVNAQYLHIILVITPIKLLVIFFNQNLNYRLDLAIFLFLQESGFNIKLFNFNFVFASIKTQEDPRTVNTLDFIPEVESEVIKDSALHMLERSLVYTSNKVFRDSKQSKI